MRINNKKRKNIVVGQSKLINCKIMGHMIIVLLIGCSDNWKTSTGKYRKLIYHILSQTTIRKIRVIRRVNWGRNRKECLRDMRILGEITIVTMG